MRCLSVYEIESCSRCLREIVWRGTAWPSNNQSDFGGYLGNQTKPNHLSVGDHVRDVISKFAQSLYALRLLRNHGMCDDLLRHVYKVVILSKLLYAFSAWWGFTSAADEQRLEASLRHAVRSSLHSADDSSFSQLVGDMDDNLFTKIQHNPHHILYILLPEKTDHTYNLRPRSLSHYLSRLIVEIT